MAVVTGVESLLITPTPTKLPCARSDDTIDFLSLGHICDTTAGFLHGTRSH